MNAHHKHSSQVAYATTPRTSTRPIRSTALARIVFGLAGLASIGCAAEVGGPDPDFEAVESVTDSITRSLRLPAEHFRPTSSPWWMYNCSSPLECVTNFDESDDGSLDAGLFSKVQGQHALFSATRLAPDIRPPSWEQLTKVRSVELVAYLQATQTGSGSTCTRVSAEVSGSSDGYSFSYKDYCLTPGAPARFYSMVVKPPSGTTWTKQSVENSSISLAAHRLGSGPRVYLADFFIRVLYDSP